MTEHTQKFLLASQCLLWLQQNRLAIYVSLQPHLRASPVSSHVRDCCELPQCVSSSPGTGILHFPASFAGAGPGIEFQPVDYEKK